MSAQITELLAAVNRTLPVENMDLSEPGEVEKDPSEDPPEQVADKQPNAWQQVAKPAARQHPVVTELTRHNHIQDHVRQHCMDPMFVQMAPMGDSKFYVLYMTNSVNADLAVAQQDLLTPEEIRMIANCAVGCKTLGSGRHEHYSCGH